LEWETENEPDIRPEDAHADIEWEYEDDGPLHDEWEPELEPVDEPGGALPDA
jgi:hypothetical protein